MTDQPKPDPQDGDRLRTFDTAGTILRRTVNVFTITCESAEIADRVADQLRTPQPTPDAAEGAVCIDPNSNHPSIAHRAEIDSVPPKPVPDPAKYWQDMYTDLLKRTGKKPAPDAMREEQKQQNRNYAASAMLACIALADEVVCKGGSAADVAASLRDRISAPVPSPDGAGAKLASRLQGAIDFSDKFNGIAKIDVALLDECVIALRSPSGTGAAEPVAVCPSCGWRFHPEVATPPVRGDREEIAEAFAKKFPAVLAQYSQFKIVDWFLSLPVQSTARPDKEAAAQVIAKRMFGEKLEDVGVLMRDNCRDTVTEIFELEESKRKRCPRCLGHGVVPVLSGASLSTKSPDSLDGDCSLCGGSGFVS